MVLQGRELVALLWQPLVVVGMEVQGRVGGDVVCEDVVCGDVVGGDVAGPGDRGPHHASDGDMNSCPNLYFIVQQKQLTQPAISLTVCAVPCMRASPRLEAALMRVVRASCVCFLLFMLGVSSPLPGVSWLLLSCSCLLLLGFVHAEHGQLGGGTCSVALWGSDMGFILTPDRQRVQ